MRSRLVSGVLWLAGARAFGQGLTWIVSIIVVRLLTPEDYGLMGMAVLFSGFLLLFNELGLGTGMVQKLDLTEEQISSLSRLIIVANVGLFAFLLLTAPFVAQYFKEPGLVSIIRWMGAGFILIGIGAPSAYLLQRKMEFKEKAAAELVGNIVGSLSTLAFAFAGHGVWSLVYGYLLLQLTTNVMYCVYARPILGHTFSFRIIGEFANMGFKVAFSRVLWYVSSRADVMIVGRALGTTQLGYYSLAIQFSSMPIDKLVTLITQVALPSFSALQNDEKRLRAGYLELVSAVALITFPIFMGLFLIAEDAVFLFLTAKWEPVILPLQMLCIVSCFRAVENLNAPLVLAKGHPDVLLRNSLLQAVVMPIAFYIGAQYGLVGVGLAWLLTRPVLFVVMTVWSATVVGLSFWGYMAGLKHATAGSLVMVAVVLLVRRFILAGVTPAVDLVVTCILGAVVYCAYNMAFNQETVQKVLAQIVRSPVSSSPRAPSLALNREGEGHAAASGQ